MLQGRNKHVMRVHNEEACNKEEAGVVTQGSLFVEVIFDLTTET